MTAKKESNVLIRHYIQFVQEGEPYAAFPINGDGTGLLQLAQNIMSAYFDDNDNPQPVPPGDRIPNEIRIVDDAGNVAARWSLAEEYECRRSRK